MISRSHTNPNCNPKQLGKKERKTERVGRILEL